MMRGATQPSSGLSDSQSVFIEEEDGKLEE